MKLIGLESWVYKLGLIIFYIGGFVLLGIGISISSYPILGVSNWLIMMGLFWIIFTRPVRRDVCDNDDKSE